jgi:putative ABC transport system ATP-binding protein
MSRRLELIDVVKHYRSSNETVRAVDGISLTVQPGEMVGLFGPSGSGKTTLLQLAAGLMAPDSGRVIFDGREISGLGPRGSAVYRLSEVGLVFQSFHLVPRASALDNVAIRLLATGMSLREARREARPWLDRLGLAERAAHAPVQLSMGERQRVAIARALVNKPRLLLADEPTGNLDSARSREVLALLRDICTERRIAGILATHDQEAARFVSMVRVLRDGRLRELDAELAIG